MPIVQPITALIPEMNLGLIAYVDPGTGSYVLQVLLAGILAGLFTIKLFWRRVIDRIRSMWARKRAE